MSKLTESNIKKQIKKYEEQRDQLLSDANQQIAAFNGAIQALEALLQPEDEAPTQDDAQTAKGE